jgi:hypothetical protein
LLILVGLKWDLWLKIHTGFGVENLAGSRKSLIYLFAQYDIISHFNVQDPTAFNLLIDIIRVPN